MLLKAEGRGNTFIELGCINCKTHTVQTSVVQGSTVAEPAFRAYSLDPACVTEMCVFNCTPQEEQHMATTPALYPPHPLRSPLLVWSARPLAPGQPCDLVGAELQGPLKSFPTDPLRARIRARRGWEFPFSPGKPGIGKPRSLASRPNALCYLCSRVPCAAGCGYPSHPSNPQVPPSLHLSPLAILRHHSLSHDPCEHFLKITKHDLYLRVCF